MVLKVREAGRIVNVHALLATGVHAEVYREIRGQRVTSAEGGAFHGPPHLAPQPVP